MSEENLWQQHVTVEASIRALPQELQNLLGRHESASLCTDWLKKKHPLESLRNTDGEAVFQWDMIGMAFAARDRFYEAISIHNELYHLMCDAQDKHGWIHKGLPLVRLRDSHRSLGHPWHEERYLLLTLVEHAMRAKGQIIPEQVGIYHRFRWENGRADSEFREISKACWHEFSQNPNLREFPEEIIGRLGSNLVKRLQLRMRQISTKSMKFTHHVFIKKLLKEIGRHLKPWRPTNLAASPDSKLKYRDEH